MKTLIFTFTYISLARIIVRSALVYIHKRSETYNCNRCNNIEERTEERGEKGAVGDAAVCGIIRSAKLNPVHAAQHASDESVSRSSAHHSSSLLEQNTPTGYGAMRKVGTMKR